MERRRPSRRASSAYRNEWNTCVKRWNRSGPLFAAAVAVAGCAGAPPTQQVNQSGYSPAFRQGYAAGCDSVGARRPRRDESRYKTDTDYMVGWNDGFSICAQRK